MEKIISDICVNQLIRNGNLFISKNVYKKHGEEKIIEFFKEKGLIVRLEIINDVIIDHASAQFESLTMRKNKKKELRCIVVLEH